jgi:nucleotide-binding universal stress UspA family protein
MKEKWNNLTMVAGIDFSPASIAAARWAITSLRTKDVVLSHALVVPEMHGILADKFPISESLLLNARTGARRRLQDVQRMLNVLDAILDVREGRPADVIADVARAHDADLIVVGKHGESGEHRGYTGRTADQLVRSAPASIIVANGILESKPQRLIVPITYSSITPYIVEWTRRLQAQCDASVTALHVVGSAVLSHVLSMSRIRNGEPPTADEIDDIFLEDRDRWSKEFIEAGIPADRVTSRVVFGEVSESVIAAAARENADMIIMGSHAGPLRRLLLGSAASAVLRNADIPVFIVTEPASEPIDSLRQHSPSTRELQPI